MKKNFSRFALLAALPMLASCGDKINDLVEGVQDQCDLKCKSAVEANGSVTGDIKADAFFKSSVKLNAQANALSAEISSTIDEMAAVLDVDVSGATDVEGKAEIIADALKGDLGGSIEGGVKVVYDEPKCEVSAEARVQASAQCDVKVDPGKASVECKGSCELKADAELNCTGGSVPKCTGTAPSFQCEGECSGTCELNVAAECEGTCKGTCELSADGTCDGECSVALNEDGTCSGSCKAGVSGKCSTKCEGTCEIEGKANCAGECKGECTYEPATAKCEGGEVPSCEAQANASVTCEGTCKGEFEPPKVDADCKASAQAEASFKAECSPPAVRLDYKLAGNLMGEAEVAARLEVEAKLKAFAKLFATLSGKGAKVKLLLNAGASLAGEVTKSGGIGAKLQAQAESGTLKEKVGAVCGVAALGEVGTNLGKATTKLGASVNAVVSIGVAVKG